MDEFISSTLCVRRNQKQFTEAEMLRCKLKMQQMKQAIIKRNYICYYISENKAITNEKQHHYQCRSVRGKQEMLSAVILSLLCVRCSW